MTGLISSAGFTMQKEGKGIRLILWPSLVTFGLYKVEFEGMIGNPVRFHVLIQLGHLN